MLTLLVSDFRTASYKIVHYRLTRMERRSVNYVEFDRQPRLALPISFLVTSHMDPGDFAFPATTPCAQRLASLLVEGLTCRPGALLRGVVAVGLVMLIALFPTHGDFLGCFAGLLG